MPSKVSPVELFPCEVCEIIMLHLNLKDTLTLQLSNTMFIQPLRLKIYSDILIVLGVMDSQTELTINGFDDAYINRTVPHQQRNRTTIVGYKKTQQFLIGISQGLKNVIKSFTVDYIFFKEHDVMKDIWTTGGMDEFYGTNFHQARLPVLSITDNRFAHCIPGGLLSEAFKSHVLHRLLMPSPKIHEGVGNEMFYLLTMKNFGEQNEKHPGVHVERTLLNLSASSSMLTKGFIDIFNDSKFLINFLFNIFDYNNLLHNIRGEDGKTITLAAQSFASVGRDDKTRDQLERHLRDVGSYIRGGGHQQWTW